MRGKKLTTDEFIERAKQVHGDKYDYSKVAYQGTHKNVCIICPVHGEFWQTPHNHLKGSICLKCSGNNHKTTEEFVKEAQSIHKNEDGSPKYDYSITRYIDNDSPIEYICQKHGVIKQSAMSHLKGSGCRHCHFERQKELKTKPQDVFITELKEVTKGKKYSFEKTLYKNRTTPVIVTCHEVDENGIEHGDFDVNPSSLLQGYGCHKCGLIKQKTCQAKTTEQFINEAMAIHGNKYDYSKVKYVNQWEKVEIICPTHGSFFVRPFFHLKNSGCKVCNQSVLEREIRVLLENKGIAYTYEKKFDWLGKMSLDFYLNDYNTAIECQGIQHFEDNDFLDSGHTVKVRDEIKKRLCDENGVRLLYYSNLGIDYPYPVFEDKDELLSSIYQE